VQPRTSSIRRWVCHLLHVLTINNWKHVIYETSNQSIILPVNGVLLSAALLSGTGVELSFSLFSSTFISVNIVNYRFYMYAIDIIMDLTSLSGSFVNAPIHSIPFLVILPPCRLNCVNPTQSFVFGHCWRSAIRLTNRKREARHFILWQIIRGREFAYRTVDNDYLINSLANIFHIPSKIFHDKCNINISPSYFCIVLKQIKTLYIHSNKWKLQKLNKNSETKMTND